MASACVYCGQVPTEGSVVGVLYWSGPCKPGKQHSLEGGRFDREIAEMNEITKHIVAGGSTRSEQAPAYHLIPAAGPRRVAIRFKMGAVNHGEDNWKKSIHAGEKEAREFCQEAYNHMIEHALKMANRHRDSDTDDDLGAIGWAVCVLAYAEDVWRKPWTEIGR